ncbi:MAG: porin [Hymenobacteraceae bacterium]|nr:porin [Hymenobacteraceae bacterium]
MKFYPLAALLGVAAPALAQTPAPIRSDSANTAPNTPAGSSLTTYGYVDAYYGYDLTSKAQDRPGFLYSHDRNNEFTVNNAIVGVRYQDDQVRGALGLHAGPYVEANYAAEPPVMRHLYEAYAGFRPTHKTWLDVGIFAAHIGFESAISKDNWTLTRSLMADNSPYYESGARLTWEVAPELTVTALVLNGWQNIRDLNRAKGAGWQIQWKLTDKLLINSSSFCGNEQPQDSAARVRYFHNFYASYAATDRLSLAAVFDVGKQDRARGESGRDTWHTAAVFAKLKLADRWSTTLRGEYYKAERSVIIGSSMPAKGDPEFFVRGGSLNVDFNPVSHVVFRVEGKVLNSRERIFLDRKDKSGYTYGTLTSSIACLF